MARKILETRVLTCGAPSYLERYGTPATPHELVNHETILFRDPQSGLPFTWRFGLNGDEFDVDVRGRISTDDPSTAVEACLAGQGIFQSFELGLGRWLECGDLVSVLGDWSDEVYSLYAYHTSRHLPPAKVRAFLDFVLEASSMPKL